jgi:hypothetical protein
VPRPPKYLVTRKRLNGPRKSRVRLGPVPFILFVGIIVLAAIIDQVWIEPFYWEKSHVRDHIQHSLTNPGRAINGPGSDALEHIDH